MKYALWFLAVVAVAAFLSPAPAAAQFCQMYSYSDMWVESSGNAVALSYTEADLCDGYSPAADVTLTMPSGYSNYNSAGGGGDYWAEAIAVADALQENGAGSVSGSNHVTYVCGEFFASFQFNISVAIAMTRVKWLGDKIDGFCDVANWCGNTSTPMCSYSTIFVGTNGTCMPAWDVESLAWKINNGPRHCLINVAVQRLDAPLSDHCTPEN